MAGPCEGADCLVKLVYDLTLQGIRSLRCH